MSPIAQPQTRMKTQRTAKVRAGLWNLVCAELTRSRRIFTWGVIGATLIFIVHTIILVDASTSSGVITEFQQNGNALAWMYIYAGGLTVPLGLLTEVMVQWREQRWCQGGMVWRVAVPHRVAGARLAVLSLSALACQAALVAPMVGHAFIVGNGQGPWDQYLLFATYMWIVVTGAYIWGVAAFHTLRVVSVGVAPVLGFVWSVVGMVQTERSNWRTLPWAWTTRISLSLLGAHGSSVLLEADSPVWDYPLLPGFLLTIGLTPAGTGLAVLCGASGGIEVSASSASRLSRLLPGGGDAVDGQSETVSVQSPEQTPGAQP